MVLTSCSHGESGGYQSQTQQPPHFEPVHQPEIPLGFELHGAPVEQMDDIADNGLYLQPPAQGLRTASQQVPGDPTTLAGAASV